ncbi:uncharacterized protein LOC116646694 isoform X2 [Phoca vitulina]|uniref:uncharacterized protein LOC116646694 isoform X2 n=1 Tax=Phoca vitulina TaxID=9720 RepID=UPI0013965BAD|nr:uncharacterized protein LOC116646694 isoform X2 [Phoca vitulina]
MIELVAKVFSMSPVQIEQKCAITGIRVIQGCDCGVHPGRRAENRPHSADSVPRGDAGEIQPPRLHGVLLYKTRSDLKVGPSRRSMLVRERISNQEILRDVCSVCKLKKSQESIAVNFTSDGMCKHEESCSRNNTWVLPDGVLLCSWMWMVTPKMFILCPILNCTEEVYGFREFDGYEINHGR